MDIFKKEIKYYIAIILTFYLLPTLFLRDTGSAMFLLLNLVPLIIFINSVLYGTKKGFKWYYFLMVAILFIPSIYIIYNESAWIYTFLYGVIALLGNFIGILIRNKKS